MRQDPLGKLEKVIEPTKQTTLAELEYDENETLLSKVDGNRNTKELLYDEYNRIKEISKRDQTGKLLSRTTIGYDEAWRDGFEKTFSKVSVTGKGESRDSVTNYYFDPFERLVKLGRMAGDKEELAYYQYDYLGNQTVSINFAGEKVQNDYDYRGKPLKSTDAEGNSTGYAYDLLGNPVSVTNALGQTSYLEYDRFGHKVIEKTPFDGSRFSTTKVYYDRVGNLTRIIDPEGYVTNQSYSERNFLKAVEKVMDSDTSNITQMEYDGEGAIQSIKRGLNSWTDPQYSEETYEYDMLGRRILTKDPEGKETQYGYDLNSNVISVTDRNKLVTSYQYDGLNRVIGRQNSRDGQKNAVHISYDLLGNKVQMSDSFGTTSHEYDPLNRLVKTNYESGIKHTYEYDDADRITGTKVLQGTLEQIALQNGYNKNGRLTRVSQNGSENESGNGSGSGRNHSYEYDVIGRMVEENDSLTGIKTDYNYYNSGSIKGMSHRSGEAVLDSFTYAYDLRGNQTQKDENGTVTQYYYDPLSRLKTVLSPNDEVLDYKYDDLSNIAGSVEITDSKFSETSCLYDRNSRLLLKETQQGDRGVEQRFSYDLEGNLKTKEEVIKQSGNLAASKKTEYIFNGFNQLEKLITPDDRLVEYTYNGNGLRTGKRIDNQAINYYYDRGNIVLETSNNEVTAKNIRGNRLISRETSSGLYNYLHNAHGDVIKLLNENGDVVKDYAFDPYGKEEVNGSHGSNDSNSFGNRRFTDVWQQEVEKIDNPFRYCGEYLDEESGLYYLRARYYDNETMRFISEDSVKGIVGDPLSLNLYSYCQGNPVRYSDPSGHLADAGGGSYGPEGTSEAIIQGTDVSIFDTYVDILNTATALSYDQIDDGGNLYVTEQQAEINRTAAVFAVGELMGASVGAVKAIGNGFSKIGEGVSCLWSKLWGADNAKIIQRLATEASNSVEGTGHVAGTLKHSSLSERINALNNPLLKSEVSYLNGNLVPCGTKGSVRLDVVEYAKDGSIKAIYDLKTGVAGLTSSRIEKILANLPNSAPVIPIRP